MKNLFIAVILFCVQNVFTQTTQEEWKYITKGYSIQKENGLGTKIGYSEKKIFSTNTELLGQKGTFNFIELIRLADNSVCGIIVESIKYENEKESIIYFGIPTHNSSKEIWDQAKKEYQSTNNKELRDLYSWALIQFISNVYLNNNEISTNQNKSRKEQEAIDKANMDGLFGNGNTTQGNPAGSGTSGGNSWSLSGRSLSGRLVTPRFEKDVDGKITVTIRVDANGSVISASIGSPTNISDATTRNAALTAAKNTKFTSGNGNASGSITYNFKLR